MESEIICRGVKLTHKQALTARGELAMLLSRKLQATGEDAFNKQGFPLEVLVARAEAEKWEPELQALEPSPESRGKSSNPFI